MKTLTTNIYSTKDTMTANLLYANGHTLEGTEWENGSCYFLFADQNSCEATIANHYKGQVKISSQSWFNANQTIKSIILAK